MSEVFGLGMGPICYLLTALSACFPARGITATRNAFSAHEGLVLLHIPFLLLLLLLFLLLFLLLLLRLLLPCPEFLPFFLSSSLSLAGPILASAHRRVYCQKPQHL